MLGMTCVLHRVCLCVKREHLILLCKIAYQYAALPEYLIDSFELLISDGRIWVVRVKARRDEIQEMSKGDNLIIKYGHSIICSKVK